MKNDGYRVVLFFLWLPNAEMAVARVENRVKQGGHRVPTEDVRRRYKTGLKNLFAFYRQIVTEWWLYDASPSPPQLIAFEKKGKLTAKRRQLYRQIEQQVEKNDEKSD